MTINEIDKQITELRNLRYEEEKKEIAEFKEKAKTNVGRCFLINGSQYVKVIDIPQEEHTMTGFTFNQYQYPALFLGNRKHPLRFDTLFSAAWGDGYECRGIEYKEISKEEFQIKFDEILDAFRNIITNI